MILRTTAIEDLVRDHPSSVRFMIGKGLPCMTCGEPVWGTFEEVARRSGKTNQEIDLLVDELNAEIREGETA